MDGIGLFETEDRLVLRHLHEMGGRLNLYALHERYSLSPGQAYSASQRLCEMGIATREGLMLVETERGFELCVSLAQELWPSLQEKAWKDVPAKIAQKRESATALYCPPAMSKSQG